MSEQDNRQITAYIVHAGTGQVMQEIREGDRFIPLRCLEREPSREHRRLRGGFMKIPATALPVLQRIGLTNAEQRLVWVLCERLQYASGRVRHKNGRPLRQRWLAEKIGITEKSLRRALYRLQELGVLIWREDGKGLCIWLNPYFCHRGQAMELRVLQAFENTPFCRAYLEGENG